MLEISYANANQREQLTHNETGPVEFGRSPAMTGVLHQVLIDDFVSRDQLLIEQFGPDTVRVQNVSSKVPVTLADGTVISPGSELLVDVPVRLTTGTTKFEIQSPTATGSRGSSMRTISAPVSSLPPPEPSILSECPTAPHSWAGLKRSSISRRQLRGQTRSTSRLLVPLST